MDKVNWVTSDVVNFLTVDKEGIGRLRTFNSGIYRWVLNSTTTILTAGRFYYHGTAFTATSPATPVASMYNEIFTFGQATKGTAANLLAGIAMSATPVGAYGWVMVNGIYTTAGVEGTSAVVATDQLKGVSGQIYVVKDTAAGTAPTIGVRLIALAAQGAGGVVSTSVLINCL